MHTTVAPARTEERSRDAAQGLSGHPDKVVACMEKAAADLEARIS